MFSSVAITLGIGSHNMLLSQKSLFMLENTTLIHKRFLVSTVYLRWHCDSNNDLMKVELITSEVVFINDIQ